MKDHHDLNVQQTNAIYCLCCTIGVLPSINPHIKVFIETFNDVQIQSFLDIIDIALTTREAKLIKLRYGLDGGKPMTLAECQSQLVLTARQAKHAKKNDPNSIETQSAPNSDKIPKWLLTIERLSCIEEKALSRLRAKTCIHLIQYLLQFEPTTTFYTSIDTLRLDNRSLFVLLSAGIKTVEQLIRMTYNDVRGLAYSTDSAAIDIKTQLEAHGFSLRDD